MCTRPSDFSYSRCFCSLFTLFLLLLPKVSIPWSTEAGSPTHIAVLVCCHHSRVYDCVRHVIYIWTPISSAGFFWTFRLSRTHWRHCWRHFCSHRWHVQCIRDFLVIVSYTSLLFTFTFTSREEQSVSWTDVLKQWVTRSSADADKPARHICRSVKVTKHSTIPYIRYSFLLYNSNFAFQTHPFYDIRLQKCRDLEIGVRCHSMSLKVATFDRLCMVSY